MISGTSEAKTWIPIFALRRVSFLLAFSPYLLLYLAVHFGSRSEFKNLWMIFPFAVIFIVIPLVDWFIGLDPANPDSDQEDKMNHQLWYTLLPALVLPLQGFTIFWAVEIYHSAGLGRFGQIAWIVSVGVVGSSVGITSAHELIHRRSRWLQNAGGLILSSMCYGSFKIEHVRSHHQNVATPLDESSARKGISLYRYFPQALIRN
ncbi:MAG: fatty acid desaturase, partial [SAR324 cluster bacterium]|nr:fatty acid desaturase [SAR324 cluster bacterium]